MQSIALEPETLLVAYSQGAFPMTDRDGATRWYTADPRGIIPLDAFHVPKSLRPVLNKPVELGGFEIRVDFDFEQCMRGCMQTREDGTWISEAIVGAYRELHEM